MAAALFQSDTIHSGLWTIIHDHDRSFSFRSQILVTDVTSRYMIAWVAVLLSLTLPCLYIMLRRALISLLSLRSSTPEAPNAPTVEGNAPGQNGENQNVPGTVQPNNEETDLEPSVFKAMMDYFHVPGDQDNPLKAVQRIFQQAGKAEGSITLGDDDIKSSDMWPTIHQSLMSAWRAVLYIFQSPLMFLAFTFPVLFFLFLFFGGIVGSVVSADMASGSVVSSSSSLAGAWKCDISKADFMLGDVAVIDEHRERRIWAYRDACYEEALCPFDQNGICLGGKQGAYQRTTGLQDSNVLGIRAPPSIRFHFQRTMTCAPLRSDADYVVSPGKPEYPNEYKYDYGTLKVQGVEYDNYTFRNPKEWVLDSEDYPSYKLSPYIYVPNEPLQSNFDARPELKAGNKIISLFFITTGGEFYHVLESHDPIFPAHHKTTFDVFPGYTSTFWVNNETKAGVLACADSYEICTDATGSTCWEHDRISEAFDYFKDNLERQRALYLLGIGLEGTYAWNVIQFVQASVLNATREARRFVGVRLSQKKEQWKVEVDGIFDAVLAGMQVRTYDYARGTYATHQNMIDDTPSRLQNTKTDIRAAVEISKMFKFRDRHYKNVSAVWFWTVNGLCVLVFLGSRRFSTAKRRRALEKKLKDGGYHDYLWATIFWDACCLALLKTIWKWMCEASTFITGQIMAKVESYRAQPNADSQPDEGGGSATSLVNGNGALDEEGNVGIPPTGNEVESLRDIDLQAENPARHSQ